MKDLRKEIEDRLIAMQIQPSEFAIEEGAMTYIEQVRVIMNKIETLLQKERKKTLEEVIREIYKRENETFIEEKVEEMLSKLLKEKE